MTITRITMFKCPDEHIKQFLEDYKELSATSTKDGKPYILSLAVGPAKPDARSQGWTLVSKSEFASLGDMKYYDEDCEAHKSLKEKAKAFGLPGAPLTVYYEPEVSAKI
ncbi:hypothetical protein BJ875DRAFT_246556 [Amylocarpus encephaloides]|uniref:Stress-response A/B barrel domain-containing protein n=1 Tax=Amylocarpus encephaloides TaxID=45428 RepID=A0A9P7YLY2_9HELO|nr:hypothetical protein BJ875DRAFT_246556 [Amylocarpus encephaloides]